LGKATLRRTECAVIGLDLRGTLEPMHYWCVNQNQTFRHELDLNELRRFSAQRISERKLLHVS
jgi:hypothetical protein